LIELLGVGVPREPGQGWLLHRVCAQIESGELTMVVSRDPAERLALLDAATGRRLPEEGRVYIGRVPITRETKGRLRARVGDADLTLPLVTSRSVLWNALATRRPGMRAFLGFRRLPLARERRAALEALARLGLRELALERVAQLDAEGRSRLVIARELARGPDHLIVREVDAGLDGQEAGMLLTTLRILAHSGHIAILASAASWASARAHGHRVIGIADRLLVYDGPPSSLTDEVIARRLGVL
jgi:phosphonate transport system ATP-binding protein